MAFAFNICGEDIEFDEEDVQASPKAQNLEVTVHDKSAPLVRSYLVGDGNPHDESTRSLLNCLPSSISYERVEVSRPAAHLRQKPIRPSNGTLPEEPQTASPVLRRPTYDILLQLKAEADSEVNQNAELIFAMEDNDRESGVYEGGLKTWEGALDLASLVMDINLHQLLGDWHIVELGAGSAIPSMVALQTILAVHADVDLSAARRRFRFTLSDYNDEVLRLSTFANVLLASKQELDRQQTRALSSAIGTEGSVNVDEDLIRDCYQVWRQAGISFNFVSGPWSKEFENATTASMVGNYRNVLILASETIYDLKSLPAFTDMVVNLLYAHGGASKAWVAAKKLYFGVGGGVDAFMQELEARGGLVREIMNTKQGVSRVVLEVTLTKEQ